jgi:hypothetical protein
VNHARDSAQVVRDGPRVRASPSNLNRDGCLCIKTIPERNGLRALGVVHRGRLFELRWCELRLYEEHERLG